MIQIKIFTSSIGCNKCKKTYKIIDKVISKFEKKINIEKIDVTTHPDILKEYNIISTPSIIINDKLEFEGKVEEIELEEKIKEKLEENNTKIRILKDSP